MVTLPSAAAAVVCCCCCYRCLLLPGWLVFTQLVETSRPFVREASMVPVYGLLAFGGQLEVLHEQGLLLLDGWAKFKAPARVSDGHAWRGAWHVSGGNCVSLSLPGQGVVVCLCLYKGRGLLRVSELTRAGTRGCYVKVIPELTLYPPPTCPAAAAAAAHRQVGVLIQALRQAVSGLLAAKVQDPSLDLAGQKVVQALHSLLATDGF